MEVWSDTERCTVLRALLTLLAEEEYQKERVFRSILAELLLVEAAIERLAGAERESSTSLAILDQRLDAAIRCLSLHLQGMRQKAIAEADVEALARAEAAEKHLFPEGLDAITRRPYAVELALVESLGTRASEPGVASLLQEKGWQEDLRLIFERKEAMQKAMENEFPALKADRSGLLDARKAFDATISRLRKAIQTTFSAALSDEKALQDRLWKPLRDADRIAKDTKAQRLKNATPPQVSSPEVSSQPSSQPPPTPAEPSDPHPVS